VTQVLLILVPILFALIILGIKVLMRDGLTILVVTILTVWK